MSIWPPKILLLIASLAVVNIIIGISGPIFSVVIETNDDGQTTESVGQSSIPPPIWLGRSHDYHLRHSFDFEFAFLTLVGHAGVLVVFFVLDYVRKPEEEDTEAIVSSISSSGDATVTSGPYLHVFILTTSWFLSYVSMIVYCFGIKRVPIPQLCTAFVKVLLLIDTPRIYFFPLFIWILMLWNCKCIRPGIAIPAFQLLAVAFITASNLLLFKPALFSFAGASAGKIALGVVLSFMGLLFEAFYYFYFTIVITIYRQKPLYISGLVGCLTLAVWTLVTVFLNYVPASREMKISLLADPVPVGNFSLNVVNTPMILKDLAANSPSTLYLIPLPIIAVVFNTSVVAYAAKIAGATTTWVALNVSNLVSAALFMLFLSISPGFSRLFRGQETNLALDISLLGLSVVLQALGFLVYFEIGVGRMVCGERMRRFFRRSSGLFG